MQQIYRKGLISFRLFFPYVLLLGFCCLLSCQSQTTTEAATAENVAPVPAIAPVPQLEGSPLNDPLPPKASEVAQPPTGPPPKDLHHKTVQNPDGTWGYDIFGDGKLLLHQPHIPALPGNAGFETETQATRVAQTAIQKMKKGESLPTISAEEVQKIIAH